MGKMPTYYRITEKALEFILNESSREYPKETGGMLIGRFDKDCVIIEHVTGPGPLAKHSLGGFRRDGDYSQRVLDDAVREFNGQFDYIGEWHSHPAEFGPSPIDSVAMHWIANNENYAVVQPIMGLCTRESEGSWRVTFYVCDGRRLRQLEISK